MECSSIDFRRSFTKWDNFVNSRHAEPQVICREWRAREQQALAVQTPYLETMAGVVA